MKKIAIILIILLIVVNITSITSAILYNSKQEALDYFETYKANREKDIAKVVSTINFTTNKICTIDYESEDIKCRVCFNYTFNNRTVEDCLVIEETSNITQTKKDVENFVKKKIRKKYPLEEVSYTDINLLEETIDIGPIK